jgi:hypothetical protein
MPHEKQWAVIEKDDHPMNDGDNPFVRYLLFGKYNEGGYWSSAHMAVQFENVVDCCVALYGEDFDFVFLFDHSCRHDRKQLVPWMPSRSIQD